MKSIKVITLAIALLYGSSAVFGQSEGELSEIFTNTKMDARLMIDSGNCEGLLSSLETTRNDIQKRAGTFYSILLIKGLCFQKNHGLAIKTLEDAVSKQDNADDFAILGYLYYVGLGTPMNKERAKELFKLAALDIGRHALWEVDTIKSIPNGDALYKNIWQIHAFKLFGWSQPKYLTDQLLFVSDIPFNDNAGSKIYEIAKHLQNGTGGYPKHPVLAFEWIMKAINSFEHSPALPEAILWAHSKRMINERYDYHQQTDFYYISFTIGMGNLWLKEYINPPKAHPAFTRYAHCIYSLLDRHKDKDYYQNLFVLGSFLKGTQYELTQQEMMYYKYMHLSPLIEETLKYIPEAANVVLKKVDSKFNETTKVLVNLNYFYGTFNSKSQKDENEIRKCWYIIDPTDQK